MADVTGGWAPVQVALELVVMMAFLGVDLPVSAAASAALVADVFAWLLG